MNVLKAKRSLSLDICQQLVGRREELEKITNFVEKNVKAEKSGCLYVSGMPGTGKTATIKRALQIIEADLDVNLICINCMQLQSASDLYKTLYTKLNLSNKRSNSKNYSIHLEKFIQTSNKMIVLCLDEIDQLTMTSQELIFSWSSLPESSLILIGIANELNLTEQILPKLRLQLTGEPFVLHFRPYTKEEIFEILKFRLCSVYDVIDASAVELCARKVSAVTGDVRKALEICKISINKIEKSEIVDENRRVKPMEIVETLGQVYGNRMSACSNTLPLQQQIVLASVLKFVSSNSKSFTSDQLFVTYKAVCSSANVPPLDSSEIACLCQNLEETFGLIRKSKKSKTIAKYYQLNVDESTARAILKDETLISKLLI